jgi:hypothetical protein
MSVDDLFAVKKTKKSSRKASDPPKEPAAKKARPPVPAEDAGSARPAPTPVASPDVSGSHLQGKSRFCAEYIIRLSDKLVRGAIVRARGATLGLPPQRLWRNASLLGVMLLW